MIKQILKRIFPLAFLKKCFLIYNKIKINTVDKVLFREFTISDSSYWINREDRPFRINHITLEGIHHRQEYAYMQDWLEWTQEEFLVKLETPCYIEPDHGWAIVWPNKLVYQSIGFSRTAHQPKPGIMKFIFRSNEVRSEKSISLRDSGEENYFHFYNDVLSKLYFLQEHHVHLQEYQVIISKKLWTKPYFQFYLENSRFLKSINWLVQESQYIKSDVTFFCKPMTHSIVLWRQLVIKPKEVAFSHRRIFLMRDKKRLRHLINQQDINPICEKFQIELIDADLLSIGQQIALFQEVNFIAGIHGAGLTNMIYCSRGCRILEIFPPPDLGYLPYHYILLAGMYKFQYRAIIGQATQSSFSGGFLLEVNKFNEELQNFLSC